ncbi:MAG TPA: DUF3604 domain-containing protein [Actinomycetota bacterium]|nr:DUF3604 domain-containing protein [Actinomycetota bacterium]
MTEIDRRTFLRNAAAAGVFLLARPSIGFGTERDITSFGTSRASRLFPGGGFVAHSDMHNHTLYSDGSGDTAAFFSQMRDAGLDIAALTEHAIQGKDDGHLTCFSGPCSYAVGIHKEKWASMRALADQADAPGDFTAIRGFEWTTGHLGHINVWLTEHFTDAEETRSLVSPRGVTGYLSDYAPATLPVRDAHDALGVLPEPFASIDGFYEWMRTPPAHGGGLDGLAGFNHPQASDFDRFKFFAEAVDRVVSAEIFTGTTDFLFMGRDKGHASPINACLNAGWKVGMLGVSDEHGSTFGLPNKGRAGMWVSELSRAGVRDALQRRCFFATRLAGLRVDASANGARMGTTLRHTSGPVEFAIDVDRGEGWYGRELTVQVLRSGTTEPVVADVTAFRVPRPDEPIVRFTTNVDIEDGAWVLLRIGDPSVTTDARAPASWAQYGAAVAYPSPFYLSPE